MTKGFKMKKIISHVLFAFCLLPPAFCQIRILKATSQKTIAGTGGVFMKYLIEFKEKKNTAIEIDSVKSIADASKMLFHFNENEISFGFSLLAPVKCKPCVENSPSQLNLTKGVKIYYKKGYKQLMCKVKKFKELEVIMQP